VVGIAGMKKLGSRGIQVYSSPCGYSAPFVEEFVLSPE